MERSLTGCSSSSLGKFCWCGKLGVSGQGTKALIGIVISSSSSSSEEWGRRDDPIKSV